MQAIRLLTEVCSLPTAPFVEGRVVEYIQRFVRARRSLRLTRDDSGNLLIQRPGRRPGLPRWVFTAHMDHPGLVSTAMLDAHTAAAEFRGSVLPEYVNGARVRFFDGPAEIPARVISVGTDGVEPWATSAHVRVTKPLKSGLAGMLDLGEARIRGRLLHSRACDDLAGLAAALAMLDRLAKEAPQSTIAVLCTRAEEVGFIGALAECRRLQLLRKTDRLIVIETSATQPYAPIGAGPIIRVGDRSSIFNSSLTWFLTQQAQSLAARRKAFHFQRALMPGGTCEATAYDVFGFLAASICIALGNYHNQDRQRGGAPEHINIDDWSQMVDLFQAIAQSAHDYRPGHATLKKKLEDRFRKLGKLL